MTIDRFAAQLAEISAEWNKAEEDIKIAEQIGDTVVYASISELRYAGRRLVDALLSVASENADEETVRSLVQDALFNCHRARHDAIDAATSAMARNFEHARSRLSSTVILRLTPDFPVIADKLQTLRNKIAESRRQRDRRDLIYSAIEGDDFKKIVEFYLRFKDSQEAMVAEQQRERLFKTASLALGAAGAALAAVCLL